MDSRELVIGGIYKHFKDKLYQVKCIAYHSETKEKMVVYQALYGDYSVYVRPYHMFMSPVDNVKYPNVKQKYRFEQVFPDGSNMPQNKDFGRKASGNEVAEHKAVHVEISEGAIQEAGIQETDIQKIEAQETDIQKVDAPEVEMSEVGTQEETIDPNLERFLDAESYEEKLDVLTSIRNSLNDKLIDAMAVSIDVEVPEGSIDSRYVSLKNCIWARAKYENLRLR